jgi:gliding motility-associated-like protein
MEQEVETIIINTAQVESTGFEANKVDNTSSVSITVYPFFIPNVITPNGDNFNQNFVINGLGKFVTNHIVIFNRYGDHVFETSSYKNDWSAFGLGSGTYFYILKTSDELKKEHVFKGWIQAIK